jgi:hypothetical protein
MVHLRGKQGKPSGHIAGSLFASEMHLKRQLQKLAYKPAKYFRKNAEITHDTTGVVCSFLLNYKGIPSNPIAQHTSLT